MWRKLYTLASALVRGELTEAGRTLV